jgi:hypothetical protein
MVAGLCIPEMTHRTGSCHPPKWRTRQDFSLHRQTSNNMPGTEVLQPPPEIKSKWYLWINSLTCSSCSAAIIDKTASFVARLGQDFEGRIYNNEKDNPKFSFLLPSQPFHGYYKKRIEEFRQELGGNLFFLSINGSHLFLLGGAKSNEAATTPTTATAGVPSTEQQAPTGEASQPQPTVAVQQIVQAQAAPSKYGPTSLAQRILAVSRKLKALSTQEQQQLQTATLAPDLFILTFPSDITPADL